MYIVVCLDDLKVEVHPKKRFIGTTRRGFNFPLKTVMIMTLLTWPAVVPAQGGGPYTASHRRHGAL